MSASKAAAAALKSARLALLFVSPIQKGSLSHLREPALKEEERKTKTTTHKTQPFLAFGFEKAPGKKNKTLRVAGCLFAFFGSS